MLRKKTNKKTLVIGALVILLCLSCLVGATLALFTNDLEDGTIGIVTTSGNVKVDIVDLDQNSLVNSQLSFFSTRENSKIYFEPGAVFYTQGFQVKNTGDVSINFRLSVSDDKQIDMDKFREAFDIWITTDLTNPDEVIDMKPFVGSLGPGDSSDTYYLFIRMKESAGNEFQGQKYEGIGVTVYAVQGNVTIKE